MDRSTIELIVFIVYLACMLGIGVFFFVKSHSGGDKEYFLGGRKMGPFVTALSAGTADMSAHLHLRAGPGPDLDPHRPGHRLRAQLDLRGPAPAQVLYRGQ